MRLGGKVADRLLWPRREVMVQFRNREEAAEQLARQLNRYRGRRPLVLGVPRGGVPMARIVAERLGGDLDIVLVHKLRAPYQEELAVGAIDEQGETTVSPWAQAAGVDEAYLDRETAQQLALIRRRRRLYTPDRKALQVAGRDVIVVDDGIATGSTLMAALRSVRRLAPARLIAAIGVAPTHTLREIEKVADEAVCGYASDEFVAVGQFFEDFSGVSDDEVIAALHPAPSAVRNQN
ncbi:MAG: phosphoribosyltransferase family protein [Bryobacterales bacterium]